MKSAPRLLVEQVVDHRVQRAFLSRVDRPHEMIFQISESGVGPLGMSLADYATERGAHLSDALADWAAWLDLSRSEA